MRNIWTIFKTDIRTLSRCFFACVVVLAIALAEHLLQLGPLRQHRRHLHCGGFAGSGLYGRR